MQTISLLVKFFALTTFSKTTESESMV